MVLDERSERDKGTYALFLENVVKTYGPIRAVDGVSLKAHAGEFIAPRFRVGEQCGWGCASSIQ